MTLWGKIRDWHITAKTREAIADRECQHTGEEDEQSMCSNCYSMYMI